MCAGGSIGDMWFCPRTVSFHEITFEKETVEWDCTHEQAAKKQKSKKNTQQLPEKESPEKELRIEPSKSNLAKLLLHLWGHTTSLLASLCNVEHAHQSIGGDVSRQNPRAVCFHCQREGLTGLIGP